MYGPVVYDLVSLIWQAKANLPFEFKKELYEFYYQELTKQIPTLVPIDFRQSYEYCVVARLLQVLGTYGLRGIIERKKHFLESISFGIKNLESIIDYPILQNYPELKHIIKILVLPETLERIKSTKPDIIVFVFHWGNEYVSFPSLEQRQLAYNLIDNGVHLIVGHHSHVIQPYEQYKNGHIIYSLGNFCFNDVPSRSLEKGMVAEVTIGDRRILDLNFKGLLVQDMSYRKDLVKPMPDALFKKSFTHTNQRYARLCRQQEHTYLSHYAK